MERAPELNARDDLLEGVSHFPPGLALPAGGGHRFLRPGFFPGRFWPGFLPGCLVALGLMADALTGPLGRPQMGQGMPLASPVSEHHVQLQPSGRLGTGRSSACVMT